jgi:hypothetical protein
MSGTERTVSGGQSRPVCISRLSASIILLTVILFWSSVKSFGLFSSEFMNPNQASEQALGSISSIDRDAFLTIDSNYTLELNSSVLYQTLIRDSFYSKNLVKNFNFFVDAIFLPNFTHYDDAGISNNIMPFSIAAGTKAYLFRNDAVSVSLKGYIGTEFIPDYNYMYNMVYGLLGNTEYRQENVTLGLSAGSSDFKNLLAEAGFKYHFPVMDTIIGFGLNGNYKVLKTGFIIPVNSNFSMLCGWNYTLEYEGWNISAGLEFRKIHIFGADSQIACSASFNPSGWFSFNLSWGFELPR